MDTLLILGFYSNTPRYNWNIVESGVKHHNPNPPIHNIYATVYRGAPPPSPIGKNMIFWCKIVIFHTKYHKHFRASLRSGEFF